MSHRRPTKKTTPKPVDKSIAINPHAPSEANDKSREVRVFSSMQQFSGPLPHPEILEKYNDVVQNGAERIFAMAEKQQNHRMDLEKFIIEQDAKRANPGLFLGFILAFLMGVGGVWVVLMGQNITGLSMILIPLATLVGIFINTQRMRKEERLAQSQTVTQRNASQKKIIIPKNYYETFVFGSIQQIGS